jgi:hypothetical protein
LIFPGSGEIHFFNSPVHSGFFANILRRDELRQSLRLRYRCGLPNGLPETISTPVSAWLSPPFF